MTRRTAGRLLGGFLVAVVVMLAGCYLWLRAPIPDDPERLEAPGLSAPVTIRYDARRRPFVTAASFSDAVYTEGWLHARERLWQMTLLARAGSGRLAEFLGPSLLATDVETTLAGVPDLARQMAANADRSTRAVVNAYVAGVNLALETAPLPLEFRLLGETPRPWTSADVFALGALMAFQSGRNMRNELLRLSLIAGLEPPFAMLFSEDHSPVHLPEAMGFDRYLAMATALDEERAHYRPPLLGSNGWVVAPERSATGNALFAFDSHDGWGMPSLFYEVHLFFGGDSRTPRESVRGFSVAGLPGVVNGFNEFMAWGFTNIGDSQDLFLETRDPENDHRYKGRHGWYDAETSTVEIPVRNAPPHLLRVVRTENGSLIQNDPPVSLAWSAAQIGDDYGLDALFLLNRATSLDAFMAAVDRFPAPSANVTYADRAGNIAFRTVGLLPERGRGQGLLPLPADEADTAWRRLLPLTELPASVNPSVGYIVKANARVRPEPPLVSADNAPGYRQARLEALLSQSPAVTFDDMARWQGDWHNNQAAWLLPAMLEALAGTDLVATGECQLLSEWLDVPVNEPDLLAPLLFDHWYIALARRVFEPMLGPQRTRMLLGNSYLLNHALDRLIIADPESPWWRGDQRLLVRQAFEDVLRTRADGGLQGTWGEAHRLVFRHEMSGAVPGLSALLDRGPYAWGGGNPTVGRARFRYDRPFDATGGATVRLVIELGDPMRIGAVMPGGQSGHPASAHYADQLPAWMARSLEAIAATPEAAGAVVTTLVP